METRYARDLVEHGKVLIRSLEAYRTQEGWSLHDPTEGRKEVRDKIVKYAGPVDATSPHMAHRLMWEQRKRMDPPPPDPMPTTLWVDCDVSVTHRSSPAWIYSMTFNPDASRFDYPTTVEITDPPAFTNALTEELKARGLSAAGSVTCKPCHYTDRFVPQEVEAHGFWFMKPERFRDEKELRCAWPKANGTAESALLAVPDIVGTCRIKWLRPRRRSPKSRPV